VSRTWAESWDAEWAGEGCSKCEQGRPDEDAWGVRWYSNDFADAYLLKKPAHPGYSVVVFRGRHVPDPALFTDEEVAGYWGAVRSVGATLYRVYQPAQINYQCLNNEVPHVHTHVLPRYVDDPGPRTLLPSEVFARARELDRVDLDAQVARLRAEVGSTS
jgi:diadenosine tetraphosphate (Ap4A) HIT family hydrolase